MSKLLANNPYNGCLRELDGAGKYYSLEALKDSRVNELPYSIRIILESSLRNCDDFEITKADVERVLNWKLSSEADEEISYKPARVLLQDFTGVPAAVDLASMRDGIVRLGGDAQRINPLVPVDLVIDHSVQVDVSRSKEALAKNEEIEFKRNGERFTFLKWAASAFKNFLIVPPGSGIVHQVNLEYLARVVFSRNGLLFPDSVVGTDSHTTMVSGIGVVGWGVGGIEGEAVMLGQPISMVLPKVVGFKLTGELPPAATATDLVLLVTRMLRQRGVVGKFVEFFGDGCKTLSVADRATVANMCPEYGATIGFFPVDKETIEYLKATGRDEKQTAVVEAYLKAQGLFREYDAKDDNIKYSGDVLELDLGTVVPCVAGPKRPHDHVPVSSLKSDFEQGLAAPVGFKGFGLKPEQLKKNTTITFKGQEYNLGHGSIVIAAITSCTNTSNPTVMIGAGMLAKAAVEKGLKVLPYIKTSLSPGSGTVEEYFKSAGLLEYLEKLGFYLCGFGCQTCIGNSGELDPEVNEAITGADLVAAAVLSGNRNFEGRVHPLTRANYLMSPMLVVAYALAGRVDVDFEKEPLGKGCDGKEVFLRDIWPDRASIKAVERAHVQSNMFRKVYGQIAAGGSQAWQSLEVPKGEIFKWNNQSTYIHDPPFFKTCEAEPKPVKSIKDAACLLLVGDSVTTDHISPAGSIAKTSPAAKFLLDSGVAREDFNSYGSRRGNDLVMARGTFANVRLINKMASKSGPFAVHVPSKTETAVFDVAEMYRKENKDLIIVAGKDYGCGSSRDWAAKGPQLLGVKAVIAESYERIHRSNLVGMGILPLQFAAGDTAAKHNLDGTEEYSIDLESKPLQVGENIAVHVKKGDSTFVLPTKCRIDTEVELSYFANGGILLYVLRKLLKASPGNSPSH